MKWKTGYSSVNIAHTGTMQRTICLGSALKSLLKKKRVSLTTVSRETGISYSTLHTWLGNRHPKDIVKVKKLADYFGVSLHELLFGEPDGRAFHQINLALPSADLLIGTFEVTVRRKVDHE
jgi:transcriptional regulator with XRE-family HTH domain